MPFKNPADAKRAKLKYYLAHKGQFKSSAKKHKQHRLTLIREAKAKPCKDCGVQYPHYVMDFDHISGTKAANISACIRNGWSLEDIKTEIAKCEVVCSNCHRERTFNHPSPRLKEVTLQTKLGYKTILVQPQTPPSPPAVGM